MQLSRNFCLRPFIGRRDSVKLAATDDAYAPARGMWLRDDWREKNKG
jgi:hypothetical protein